MPLYQTAFTIVAAYALMFLPRALISLRASIAQAPIELERAAASLGRRPLNALWATTIRLSAMSRKDETEIMRYVGASNFFIELPFILEGIIAALMGSILAVAGLWITVKYFITDWLGTSMSWMQIIGTNDVWRLSPFLVVGAIVVAGIASWVTLRRYAKV